MRIAVIHYHLRRGGVARVIENTLAAMGRKGLELVVLAEECPGLTPELRRHCVTVPDLRYQTGKQRVPPEQLEKTLRIEAKRKLGGSPDVWHIHNHHLGKNPSLTVVAASLARAGEKLLLHIHDFPEDGRAENYRTLRADISSDPACLQKCLYPAGTHILYGTLNRRDYNILATAGLPREQLRFLANPVAPIETNATKHTLPGMPFESLTLYPTRAIRRKNLGELLLWAALAPPGQGMGCTLAPDNPAAKPRYQRWVAQAQQWALPIEFELSARYHLPFAELIAAADQLITTSIAEGFGLAFLEPWMCGRSVVGRNLPAITSDFAKEGIDLSHLYNRLEVPLAWLDVDALQKELTAAIHQVYEHYSWAPKPSAATRAFQYMATSGLIDFGQLGEIQQEQVIKKILRDPAAAAAIRPKRLESVSAPASIARNRETVRRQFSLEAYSERLIACYQYLAEATPSRADWIEPEKVLEQFLNPAQFSLLRI